MKSTDLHHILLTRFSYRQNPEDHRKQTADVFVRNDPLTPACLDFRFALFETACLPNVLGQTNQNFDWVLIIDPELPKEYRDRLQSLLAGRKRTHLYEFQRDDLGSMKWLEAYISKEAEYVLTTNLDDDDIITVDYINKLHTHIYDLGENVPSMKYFGIKSTYQWDLYSSQKHPFGTWAPWHRTHYFKSTGLSMLCNKTLHPMTVYSLHHSHGDIWYARGSRNEVEQIARKAWGLSNNEKCPLQFKHLTNFQEKLDTHTKPGSDDWKSLPSESLCHDFSKDGLFAVHLNHFVNDQATRLFERKAGTVPVIDTQFFPNDVVINWTAFNHHLALFELSSSRYEKFLIEIKSYSKKLKLNWWKNILMLVSMRTRLAWFFFRN